MDSLDRKPFATELLKLAEAFGTKVSEARAEAYFEALMDFDVYDIRAACQRAIREDAHFPRVSRLRELAALFQTAQRRAASVQPEAKERLRCGPDVPCEACEIVGCECPGCVEAIAKCRAEFTDIARKAAAGGLVLMRVPPPPTREATREDYARHEERKRLELEKFQREALATDDEVPF